MKHPQEAFRSAKLFDSGYGYLVVSRFKADGRVESGFFLLDVFAPALPYQPVRQFELRHAFIDVCVSASRLRHFLILALWFGLTLSGQSETEYKSSHELVGSPVSIDKEIQGEAGGFASLGYSGPRDNLFQQQIVVGKETNAVYWRINLSETKAEVTSAGGAYKEVMTTEWSIFSKKSSQLRLMRTTGNLAEVIVINPRTGTFVYTRERVPLLRQPSRVWRAS